MSKITGPLYADAVDVSGVKTITITLSFRAAEKITVKFSVEGTGGKIKAEKDGTEIISGKQFDEGTVLTFKPKPDTNKFVERMKKNGEAQPCSSLDHELIVNRADAVDVGGVKTITVTVSFRDPKKFTIKFNAEGDGGNVKAFKMASLGETPVAIASGDKVDEGMVVIVRAVPEAGKTYKEWKLNGIVLDQDENAFAVLVIPEVAVLEGEVNTITFTVSFRKAEQIKLIFETDGAGGTITAEKSNYRFSLDDAISSSIVCDENMYIIFTAEPESGKSVDKWTKNGTAVGE